MLPIALAACTPPRPEQRLVSLLSPAGSHATERLVEQLARARHMKVTKGAPSDLPSDGVKYELYADGISIVVLPSLGVACGPGAARLQTQSGGPPDAFDVFIAKTNVFSTSNLGDAEVALRAAAKRNGALVAPGPLVCR
jgi:hypothetical protein